MEPLTSDCSACGASFDLSGKPAGAEFRCPKCGEGTIRAAGAPIGTLDAGLEIGSPDELTDEVGSPDELTDEVGSPDELTDEAPAASPARRTRTAQAQRARGDGNPAERKAARRVRTQVPAAKKSRAPLVIAAIAVAAAAAFALLRNGDDSTPQKSGTGNAAEVEATAPTNEVLAPAASAANRFAALSADDLAGREELAAFCEENGLTNELRALQVEILLLDPTHSGARAALGFERYEGSDPRFRGCWLSPEDQRLVRLAPTEKR